MNRRVLIIASALAALAVGAPDIADAQMNCRVTVPPLAFGTYSPGIGAPLDVTGSIDVSCRGRPGIFLVTLATGSSGSYAARTMLSGPYTMFYNLYLNAARTLVWGDGTGGTVIGVRLKGRFGRQDFTLPVYGRIPPLQSVGAGFYQDDVLVTVIF